MPRLLRELWRCYVTLLLTELPKIVSRQHKFKCAIVIGGAFFKNWWCSCIMFIKRTQHDTNCTRDSTLCIY